MSARRAVLLTLIAIGLLALLAGGVFLYLRADERAGKNDRRADRLQTEVLGLKSELREAKKEAARQFQAGIKAEQDINKSVGFTYEEGRKDGRDEVFSGFSGGWTPGGWYYVKIGFDRKSISDRVDVTPCELTYLTNDQIFGRGSAC